MFPRPRRLPVVRRPSFNAIRINDAPIHTDNSHRTYNPVRTGNPSTGTPRPRFRKTIHRWISTHKMKSSSSCSSSSLTTRIHRRRVHREVPCVCARRRVYDAVWVEFVCCFRRLRSDVCASMNEVNRHSLECQPYRRRSSPSPRGRRRVVGNHHCDRVGSVSSRNRRRRIVQEEEETDRVMMP